MTRGGTALKGSEDEAAERLLVESAQKDPSRFAEIYEENFDRVYAFIARRVRDRDQVQDLTSDVFHQALKNLPRFEWRGVPFAAWLLRIAANAITDHSRRASNRTEVELVDDPPAEQMREVEHQARLFKLVAGLPKDQRSVITMRLAEQKTTREIARELRRTEGAIKQ